MENLETRVVECPYVQDFPRHDDPAKFAREYIPTLQSWSENTFAVGLSPARPKEERQKTLDHYYDAYETRVSEDPTGHAKDYVHYCLIVQKL